MTASRIACALALAAGACSPLPEPQWLLGEPELLALRLEVVAEGEASAPVASPPADRLRAEMLPGDTVRLRPWVAGGARVFAEDDLDIAYFACFATFCPGALRNDDALDPCDGTVDLRAGACLIGRGHGVEYTLPTDRLDAVAARAVGLMAVGGVPGVGDTNACIEALRGQPYGELGDCMMLTRGIGIGPQWVVALLLQEVADAAGTGTDGVDTDGSGTDTGDGSGLDPFVPPPEVYLEWPNFNPEAERFTVVITRRGASRALDARADDRIPVQAGDRVRLNLDVDPRDTQRYAYATVIEGEVVRFGETVSQQWFATHPAVALDEASALAPVLDFAIPGDTDALRLDVRVDDGRGGVGWASLHFEVDATP